MSYYIPTETQNEVFIMNTTLKQYVFSGLSDNLEDLTFGDEYLDENYVHGEKTPKEWITTGAEDKTKH